MKRWRTRTALFAFLLAITCVHPAFPRGAFTSSTLSLNAGQQRLTLAAPDKMCFIDKTATSLQRKIYTRLAGMTESSRAQVLLAVFMDCANITDPDNWYDGMPAFGFITWLNPSIGATTSMSRQDYLDMREADFPKYAQAVATGLQLDKKVHRTAQNASMGMTGEEGVPGGIKHKNITLLSTTLLRQVPVEVTLHFPDASAQDAYMVMDKFMARQVALNNN